MMSDRMPSAKLLRNSSMAPLASNGLHSLNLNNESDDASSPLKLFKQAKQSMNSIYQDFNSIISEINAFFDSAELKSSDVVSYAEIQKIQSFKDKCEGLIKMISRDRMKCVFFGRTSNGKSSTINAMLHQKILPMGIGHTTNCFLQVEGSDLSEQDACFYIPGCDQPEQIKNLLNLGSALSKEKLDSSSLVRVLWPKEKCRLLKEDVVLVDSPGIDVSIDLDTWIDQNCLDADVFVLVVNAESTLTKTEKDFFHKVSEKLTQPNIFILNNRWDATAYEPETAEIVRDQHIERDKEFLCNELKTCDKNQANSRIYFISAREVLLTRTQNNPQLPPGYQNRLLQFEWFEEEFEKCISMSAVKTKFDQPAQRGKAMAATLSATLENCHQQAIEKKNRFELNLKNLIKKIHETEQKLQDFTQDMKDKIRDVMEDVEKNVTLTLNDEIRRISILIDEFERPFHPDESQLNWYKKEMNEYLDQKLGLNLAKRLDEPLIQSLQSTQNDIKNRVLELVESEENRKLVTTTLFRDDFYINYRLNCSNLCADFREDISFHFSLGFTSLMRRFTGNRSFNSGPSRFFIDTSTKFNQQKQGRHESSNLAPFQSASQATNFLVMLQGVNLIASKSNVVLLAVGGIVWRGLGWKILALTGSLYGLCYLYERLMWTKKSQEKMFKKQYADYASSKLRLIVDLTSQNAASQVKQELAMYFSQMSRYIDITKDEYFQEVKKYQADIDALNQLINRSKILKNKGKYVHDDFDKFINEFLAMN